MSIPIYCAHTRLADPNSLKPNSANPNRHSAHQIQLLASIIQEQGWRNPITLSKRSGQIVRGHGRLEAAPLIGCEAVPVDEQDYATEAEELADLLADNRLAELAELDEGELKRLLKSIQESDPTFDLELTGFMDDEIRKLFDEDEAADDLEVIPKMECQAFEHHDYLVFMFHDLRDWMQVLQFMGVREVDYSITRTTKKLGIGRVVHGAPRRASALRSRGAEIAQPPERQNDSSNSANGPLWPELQPLNLRLIILSRSRARTMTSHRLFPSATLLVPESELEQYAAIPLEKATVPDSVMGISSLRNWVLKQFTEEAIIMLDDDISACVCMVSLRCRKLSVEETLVMLTNSAYNARGAGARLFGWHQRSDPRLLQRNDPFGINHWVGGAVGVVRDAKGGVPVWDELLKCKCDIDATLQELMDNRLVWNEARFCFVQERDKNLGGNSLFRSADRIATEKRHLKRKWKAHITFENYKSQDKVAMHVPRRQSVALS